MDRKKSVLGNYEPETLLLRVIHQLETRGQIPKTFTIPSQLSSKHYKISIEEVKE